MTASEFGAPAAGRPGGSFVEQLVARLHREYDVDPAVIRSRVTQVLGSFEGARVQSFVPVLVEKRVRAMCRGQVGDPGMTAAVGLGPG